MFIPNESVKKLTPGGRVFSGYAFALTAVLSFAAGVGFTYDGVTTQPGTLRTQRNGNEISRKADDYGSAALTTIYGLVAGGIGYCMIKDGKKQQQDAAANLPVQAPSGDTPTPGQAQTG